MTILPYRAILLKSNIRSGGMAVIKKTISIPQNLFEKTKELKLNFSALVADALEKYIEDIKVEQGLASFGSWDSRDEDSVTIVNKLRDEAGRNYANRSD